MNKVPFPLENGTNQRIYAMAAYLRNHYRVGLVVPYNSTGINALYEIFDEVWFQQRYTSKLGKIINLIQWQINKILLYSKFSAHLKKFAKNPLGKYNVSAAITLYRVCQDYKPCLIICQKVTSTVLSTAIAHTFNIPIVIDTHDLYSLQLNDRKKKVNVNLSDFPPISPQHEKDLLSLYDAMIAIQYVDNKVLAYHFPAKKIITALHPVKKVFLNENTDHIYTNDPVLLFVASASPHNKDAILHFIKNELDYITKYYPNVVVNICGDVGENLQIKHRSIRILGRVEDLEPFYNTATLVINPVRYGSGLKIKTVDALAAGKCLVTTPNGAEGLPSVEEVLVCAEVGKIGEKIVELLNNKSSIRLYELAAYKYAKANLTANNCYAELEKLIMELIFA